MGVDGSQYAAYRLEHDPPPKHAKGDSERRMSWRGFSQDTSLLLDMANTLEMIHANLLQMGGVKKAKPNLVYGPGVERKTSKGVVVDAAHSTPQQAVSQLRALFQGHGLA